MTTHCSYDLPSILPERLNVEQEAMLVMSYASMTEAPPSGRAGIAPTLPSPEDTIHYLRAYMRLELPPLAPEGGR